MNTAQAQALLAQREARERAYQERIRAYSSDPDARATITTCRRMVEEFRHHVGNYYDIVREVRLESNFDAERDIGATLIVLDCGGTSLPYRLTDDEILMGGPRGVGQFLDHVEHDLCSRFCLPTRNPGRWELRGRALVEPRPWSQPQRSEHFRWMSIDMLVHDESARLTPEVIQRAMEALYGRREDPAAQQKAKDLFVAVAGREAFDKLEGGGYVEVIGGDTKTVYELRKKASFCIRRRKDGADLCAVVPGVPLYDHLLGIKLMIEHQETRFLKTANVSGAMVPGGITWVRNEDEQRRSMFSREEMARRDMQQREMYRFMWQDVAQRLVNPPMIVGIDTASELRDDAFHVTMTARVQE